MDKQALLDVVNRINWSELGDHARTISGCSLQQLLTEFVQEENDPNDEYEVGSAAEIWNTLCYQGTRTKASLYAIPVLVRVALEEEHQYSNGALGLLTRIAVGEELPYMPEGMCADTYRRDTKQTIAAYSSQLAAEIDHRGYGLPVDLAAYEAVRAHVPDFIDVIRNNPGDRRAKEIVHLLAWFSDYADMSLAVIARVFAVMWGDKKEGGIATCLVAMTLLSKVSGSHSQLEKIVAHLDSGSEYIQAHIALAKLSGYSHDMLHDDAYEEPLLAILNHILPIFKLENKYRTKEMAFFFDNEFIDLCLSSLSPVPQALIQTAGEPILADAQQRGYVVDTLQYLMNREP